MGGATYLITGMLLAGVIDDLRSRKVHNVMTVAFLVVSCVAVPLLGYSYLAAIKSFGFTFVIGLALFLPGVLGGGDTKLMLAVSPLLPPEQIVGFFIASLFWGSILGIFMALLHGRGKSLVNNLGAFVFHRAKVRNGERMPFTVGLLFGFLTIAATPALPLFLGGL